MEWALAAILVLVAFLFLRRRSNTSGEIDDRAVSIINPWFREKGIEPGSVRYSVYSDTNLLSPGATNLYVGIGYAEGQPVGFVIEIAGDSLMTGTTINPNAASHHSTDARQAQYEGVTLKGKLIARSLRLTTGN